MSGFRHLYLVSVDVNQGTRINNVVSQHEARYYQFTSGEWEVDGSKVCVIFNCCSVFPRNHHMEMVVRRLNTYQIEIFSHFPDLFSNWENP